MNKPKIFLTAALILAASSCTQRSASDRKHSLSNETFFATDTRQNLINHPNAKYGGIYAYRNTAIEGAEGTVYIYPEADGDLMFYLNKCIGDPSYRRAIIDGRITLQDGKGTFRESHFDKTKPDCVLHFYFGENAITVVQEEECDCNFMENIFVNDRFERVSNEIPQKYTISNRPIFFDQWQKDAKITTDIKQSTFTDTRDGQTYKTVTIGTQTWMAENLNYVVGTNYCYENSALHCQAYGRLYSWGTALRACPDGWRLPDLEDWRQLIETVKNQQRHDFEKSRISSGYAFNGLSGITLKSETGWYRAPCNTLVRGTDDWGFSALPAGARNKDGDFRGIGTHAYWWVADEDGEWAGKNTSMTYEHQWIWESYANKASGYSVRCIKCEQEEGEAVMPSQNFVGKWGDEHSHITIWNIFDDEIDFSWYDAMRYSAIGIAKIEGNKIAFIARGGGEDSDDSETPYTATGTMHFTQNGIILTVEKTDNPLIRTGQYTYPEKQMNN